MSTAPPVLLIDEWWNVRNYNRIVRRWPFALSSTMGRWRCPIFRHFYLLLPFSLFSVLLYGHCGVVWYWYWRAYYRGRSIHVLHNNIGAKNVCGVCGGDSIYRLRRQNWFCRMFRSCAIVYPTATDDEDDDDNSRKSRRGTGRKMRQESMKMVALTCLAALR